MRMKEPSRPELPGKNVMVRPLPTSLARDPLLRIILDL
jgi:hypothetical protein